MPERRNPTISLRKSPKQTRSEGLIAIVLEAAAQVLAKEGAQRFTTARVAEKAGVSVGSIYQYFPNKAAILFRLQSDEWQQTSAMMRDILEDKATSPLQRLRRLTHAFIQSECDEVGVRSALNDAAPLYRVAPEAHDLRTEGTRRYETFIREVLPAATETTIATVTDIVSTTLGALGKEFSEQRHDAGEISAYSDAVADMLCAYLVSCGARSS